MTEEIYPKTEDFILVSDVVEAYLNFIESLKKTRNSKIDNEILLDMLSLFHSVKTDDNTINTLKQWLDELDNLVEKS